MSTRKKRFIQLGISVVLIAMGVVGLLVLTASKPEMKKRQPPAPVPMVRIIKTHSGPQTVYIRGEGTVRPLREINLVSEVGGKVVRVSPALVNGGVFKKDDTLLQIDNLLFGGRRLDELVRVVERDADLVLTGWLDSAG